MPLVDELAADIFMGEFTAKFVNAAKIAGELLEGTLYDQYYKIDYATIADLPTSKPKRGRHRSQFAKLCASRANVRLGGWDVVKNGRTIEQQQILTTQNLAVLFSPIGSHRSPPSAAT